VVTDSPFHQMSPPGKRLPRPARGGIGLLALLGGIASGCVTVYQPLVSLQRPAPIDNQLASFQGQRFLIRCLPGEYLAATDTQRLCFKVRNLFAVQGAEVEVEVPVEGRPAGAGASGARPDLSIELRSRLLHQENSMILWFLSIMSFTLVPTIAEFTFAQEVTIRDGAGFVLASDSLQGRFVRYFGLGVWGVNRALDLLVRSDDEKLTGDLAQQEFSRDYYQQVSQLAFDAHMRSLVLRGFEPQAAPAAAPAAPAATSPGGP
jgi:hypothetical protein